MVRVLLNVRRSSTDEAQDVPSADAADVRSAQTFALRCGAGLALVLSVGSAAVMSLSVQAQQLMTSVGFPYRHTVVTWVALVTALVLVLVALDLRLREVQGVALWATAAAAAALVGAIMLPANLADTRAANVLKANQTVDQIYREVALGDPTPSGDRRRCDTIDLVAQTLGATPATRNRLVRDAYLAYRYYHPHHSYCSTRPKPVAAVN
jgi:hypothetical protein